MFQTKMKSMEKLLMKLYFSKFFQIVMEDQNIKVESIETDYLPLPIEEFDKNVVVKKELIDINHYDYLDGIQDENIEDFVEPKIELNEYVSSEDPLNISTSDAQNSNLCKIEIKSEISDFSSDQGD